MFSTSVISDNCLFIYICGNYLAQINPTIIPLSVERPKVMLIRRSPKFRLCTMNTDYSLKETVFRTFLKHPDLGPTEMAEKLGANYNSVKAAYAKLCDEEFFRREGRGDYTPDVAGILLDLLDRIEVLEAKGA
jgi:hypothetical protein